MMFICKGYKGKTFKYSAEIPGIAKEDPIIIIGKDKVEPLGCSEPADPRRRRCSLGIVLTLVALRLFVKQRPT